MEEVWSCSALGLAVIPAYVHLERAVYHMPSVSVTDLAYFSNSLSLSFASTAMSSKNGAMSFACHRVRVRNRSAKRAVGSVGSSLRGKYVSWGSASGETDTGAGAER